MIQEHPHYIVEITNISLLEKNIDVKMKDGITNSQAEEMCREISVMYNINYDELMKVTKSKLLERKLDSVLNG